MAALLAIDRTDLVYKNDFWKTKHVYYELDWLFYGNGDLLEITYRNSSFLLDFAATPSMRMDPSLQDGRGEWVVTPKDPSQGLGSANPDDALHASEGLAKVGSDLVAFRDTVMKPNASAINGKWAGPAHESVKTILGGFDHWVNGVLDIIQRPGGYVQSTLDISNHHRYAQSQQWQITTYYRNLWHKHLWEVYGQVLAEFDDKKYRYYQNFDSDWFDQWLALEKAKYPPWVDANVLGPARRDYDANVKELAGKYERLVGNFRDIPLKPFFPKAPPAAVTDPANSSTTSPLGDLSNFLSKLPLGGGPGGIPAGSGLGIKSPAGLGGGSALKMPTGSGGPGSVGSGLGGGLGGDPGGGLGGVPGGGSGLPSPVSGPDGAGFDVTGDGVPDLGLNGAVLPGSGLPAGSRIVTRPDGSKGVDLNGDGIADVGMDGRALPGGSLPEGTKLVAGPNGTGIDVTGDGVPDIGLDGNALPGGGLPAGSRVVTLPDGTQGIDLNGDGVPDIGFDGKALPGGGLPDGARLAAGPDGTTGIDVTSDGIPDFDLNGQPLPGSSLFNHPGAPDLSGQVLQPADGLRVGSGSSFPGVPVTAGGSVAGLSTAAAGVPGAATSASSPMYPPMYPPMGGMGGGGGQDKKDERERQTWLMEDDAVWKDDHEPVSRLGRPKGKAEPEVDEWELPDDTPARTRPGGARPGQRSTGTGWSPGRANS